MSRWKLGSRPRKSAIIASLNWWFFRFLRSSYERGCYLLGCVFDVFVGDFLRMLMVFTYLNEICSAQVNLTDHPTSIGRASNLHPHIRQLGVTTHLITGSRAHLLGLNSHYFHMIREGHNPNSRGYYLFTKYHEHHHYTFPLLLMVQKSPTKAWDVYYKTL